MLLPFNALLLGFLASSAVAKPALSRPQAPTFYGESLQSRELLQNIVTWDERSLFVHGERVLIWSGEFHPFRLPVAGLYLDVFQKIKGLGYNAVSFYVSWSLLEGTEGELRVDGIFDLEPFFEAASTAGIYLIARPGPYINAEVSGGGFPSWLQRNPAFYRTRDPAYLNATQNYMSTVGGILAKAQITNGGPIILVQPENEYTSADKTYDPEFPDAVYWQYVMDQLRNAGIVVPLISNDAAPDGNFAPGPPAKPAAVDIYGHDGYPLGFDCSHPTYWAEGDLPTNYGALHLNQSSSTPYSILEFQGGSFDEYNGPGFEKCTELLGSAFERVFYKNNFSFGLAILNIYMTYGGTNWGNQGLPGTYTSYDYGAAIAEDRTVNREKYSEVKLIANFLQASADSYLEAIPQSNANATGAYTDNKDLFVTTLVGQPTRYYVIRHTDYSSNNVTSYCLTVPVNGKNITVPQLNGTLSLHGRDSKFFVTDYDLDGLSLLYSTAEIFTWKRYGDKRVLVVYTGPGEVNEVAVVNGGAAQLAEGAGVTFAERGNATVMNFATSSEKRVVTLANRQSAYDYWVVDLPNNPVSGNYTNYTHALSAPIVKGGNLLRSVTTDGTVMKVTGDVNATTPLEIVGGAPKNLTELWFNDEQLKFNCTSYGSVVASVSYEAPQFTIPDLSKVRWREIDSLPEIQPGYDDSLWPEASLTYSNRSTIQKLMTPTSLFAGDYGFSYGSLLFRGHFTSSGNESSLYLSTQGGPANGYSVWLNQTYIGSWVGYWNTDVMNMTFALPQLKANEDYVLTLLMDSMSLDENYDPGDNSLQDPRGILNYALSGRPQSAISWKLTGNLGGEQYIDKVRGPLNEGGLYAERQGYHQPGVPASVWSNSSSSPSQGTNQAGVAFYSTTIDLDLPTGYLIPLGVSFGNGSTISPTATPYRCQVYVNGYQYGKYINIMGPQSLFPVPEGIWNYQGSNTIAVSLFAQDATGANIEDLQLIAGFPVQTSFELGALSPRPSWSRRAGAY